MMPSVISKMLPCVILYFNAILFFFNWKNTFWYYQLLRNELSWTFGIDQPVRMEETQKNVFLFLFEFQKCFPESPHQCVKISKRSSMGMMYAQGESTSKFREKLRTEAIDFWNWRTHSGDPQWFMAWEMAGIKAGWFRV